MLPPSTRKQVDDICTCRSSLAHSFWTGHGWQVAAGAPRAVFTVRREPATAMTACLPGKVTERDVYKVDLSLVMSKSHRRDREEPGAGLRPSGAKRLILFLTKPMRCLAAARRAMRTTATPIKRSPFCCRGSRRFDGIAILASNLRDNVDDSSRGALSR